MKNFRSPGILLILIFAIGLAAQTLSANILRTGPSELGNYEKEALSTTPDLAAFVASLRAGLPSQVSGIYASGVMAFPVVQQSISNAGEVSDAPETVTEFRMAAQYNAYGMLAHDDLAGAAFSKLRPGDEIILVFGDGGLRHFQVYDIQRYQALSPNSPYSSFVRLSDQTKVSADTLFYRTFGLGNSTLVLQTCISTPEVPSWGRIFVLARPIESALPDRWSALPWVDHSLKAAAGR